MWQRALARVSNKLPLFASCIVLEAFSLPAWGFRHWAQHSAAKHSPEHGGVLTRTPGLFPLDTSSTWPQAGTTERYPHIVKQSLRGEIAPGLMMKKRSLSSSWGFPEGGSSKTEHPSNIFLLQPFNSFLEYFLSLPQGSVLS